jgi:transcriptional regulator with XRE-family HTH domain
MDYARVLKAIMRATGWNQEVLADNLKTTQATISRWLKGREPKGKAVDRIRELAVEHGVVTEAARPGRTIVPVEGYIGAGAEIEPEFEQGTLEEVEIPLAVPDEMIAFKVKGFSMVPRYDEDDVVLVHRHQRRTTSSLIGTEAAVRTADNRRYLKKIAVGPKPNTFNLESFNARTIRGAKIDWASEIWIVVKASRVRALARKQPLVRKPVRKTS